MMVKVSIMVPVTRLVSMLIKHVGGEVGMRISVRIRCGWIRRSSKRIEFGGEGFW